MEAPTNYDDLKYNELKSLASQRGLAANGTKEDIIDRLKEDDASTDGSREPRTGDQENADDDQETGTSSKGDNGEKPFKPLSPVQDVQEQRKADVALRSDAKKMKDHLDKQPKVSIMIPFDQGEDPKSAGSVPFALNMNGYKMDLPRGQYIDVPRQVAEVIKERLESEGKIGRNWRIDNDSQKQDAIL